MEIGRKKVRGVGVRGCKVGRKDDGMDQGREKGTEGWNGQGWKKGGS